MLDVEIRSAAFQESSPTSKLAVLHPAIEIDAKPSDQIEIRGGYEADIVSGASEAIKGGRLSNVDVVSSATHFEDTRHVVSGGFALRRESTELNAGYSYGTESDYRSHGFNVGVSTNFLQKNTEVTLGYGRGFDQVCTSRFETTDAPSGRVSLDSSIGCFTDADNRQTRDVTLDDLQVGWTQAWTPVLVTQLIMAGALEHGFLGNPYRSVVIAPAGDLALENHPENRARGSLSARGRFFLRPIETVIGASARLYRDTWDIFAQTYEVTAERHLFAELRGLLRGRYYTQGGALFWSDDYTGGEPLDGPRGQYWTGDRELSPLSSYLLGARIVYEKKQSQDGRLLGLLLGFSATAGMDLIKTNLESFTWAGTTPDDTLAILLTGGVRGEF